MAGTPSDKPAFYPYRPFGGKGVARRYRVNFGQPADADAQQQPKKKSEKSGSSNRRRRRRRPSGSKPAEGTTVEITEE